MVSLFESYIFIFQIEKLLKEGEKHPNDICGPFNMNVFQMFFSFNDVNSLDESSC